MRVLVAGATGYIGGRLVPQLLAAGHTVRCMARTPGKLALQPWRDRVEVVRADVLDAVSLKEAAADCDAAFYLVRATGAGKGFAAVDREGAANFRDAAEEAGLRRLVYLGARGPSQGRLSPHIASRHEVGEILAAGTVPVTEIRTAHIIGSGSLSFEMLRYLTEALPLLAAPRWVRTRCQPVAVRDVLEVLVTALDDSSAQSRRLDVGGPEVMTYADMMRAYAAEARLRRRLMIPLPLRFPRLSALWIGLVTPLPPSVARPLVDELGADNLAPPPDDGEAAPQTPLPVALQRALARLPNGVITRWSDAESSPAHPSPDDPQWRSGTLFMERHVVPTSTDDSHLFWAFSRIGGSNGYYGLDWAWRVRGLLDQLAGGVGLRRGRRHPTEVRPGEAIDFWRVEEMVPGLHLRLRAEMRHPGVAWLEWETRHTDHGSDLVQTAWFMPRGLFGRLYWYLMLPAHRVVFPRMARRVAAAAEERYFSH